MPSHRIDVARSMQYPAENDPNVGFLARGIEELPAAVWRCVMGEMDPASIRLAQPARWRVRDERRPGARRPEPQQSSEPNDKDETDHDDTKHQVDTFI